MLLFDGHEFENEVRNIARQLYSNSLGQGSQKLDGRERDGVFWNGDLYTIIEATTERTRAKAEYDGKKTHDLVTAYRRNGDMARGLLITLHEPTTDQKDYIKKFSKTVKILSFDELRSSLFDAPAYISTRSKRPFGSIYDYARKKYEVPRSDFVEPTIIGAKSGNVLDVQSLTNALKSSGRLVITSEYGVGKSMLVREVFFRLCEEYNAKRTFRVPVFINLRDHIGQSDPVELIERHARANGVDPRKLVGAWGAGYVDLLIDGFDELSTRGWSGDPRKLRSFERICIALSAS